MSTGRPLKPTVLKALGGTLQPSRTNAHEPTPDVLLPLPPEWLSETARAYWSEVGAVLPYSRIDEMGAGMYKGQNVPIAQRKPAPVLEANTQSINLQRIPAPEAQMDERLSSTQEAGGSIPTPALTLTPAT